MLGQGCHRRGLRRICSRGRLHARRRPSPGIDERTVYVADYIRGLDVLEFTGDIGGPPRGEGKPPKSR